MSILEWFREFDTSLQTQRQRVRIRDLNKCVPAGETFFDVSRVVRQWSYTNVFEQDQVVGLVNAFDILFDETRRESLASYTRRIVTATEDEPAYRIVQRLRAARLGLAAVTDSQKRLIGIVTGEDIIQRLVQIGAL
jgi:DNA phosphorothioation-dependent restriction protein DptG